MSRKRTPRALKVVKGTLRKHRDHPEPNLAPFTDREPPEWLNGCDAIDAWRHLVAILEPAGVLTAGDHTALAHAAQVHGAAVARWRQGIEPTAAMLVQLRLLLVEFGLTPASRGRVRARAGTVSPNPFALI